MNKKLAKLQPSQIIASVGEHAEKKSIIQYEGKKGFEWYLVLPTIGKKDHTCLHLETFPYSKKASKSIKDNKAKAFIALEYATRFQRRRDEIVEIERRRADQR